MADENKDYQLNELQFMGWPLNDNDLLIMEDVSNPLPLRKIRLCTLRSAFVGGWPSLEDTPEGVVTPPTFSVKGIEGGWRIRIHNRVSDAKWYFIHKLNYATEEYEVVKAIPESRDPHEKGTPQKSPLIYDYLAPITDTPNRYYGKFKVQSVSHEYRGPLSDSQECWTLYDLPSDWKPDAPTLLTAGGYPLTSYAPQDDGSLGYTISIKIQAPDGQKNLIEQYMIFRICDEGTGSFTAKNLKRMSFTPEKTPRPKIFIYHDTDAKFVVGYKYRYTVGARGLKCIPWSTGSNFQDVTLINDTTPPDDPVFTVKTSPGNIEVIFDPIEVGGEKCNDWDYILLQYRIDGGAWVDKEVPKTLSAMFSIAEADYSDEYEFQAKVFDYAGNENEGGWQTDPAKYTAGVVTELCFGTPLNNRIDKIEINEGDITTHTTEISQNATDILLRATKTYVDSQDGALDGRLTTAEAEIVVNATNILLRATKTALNVVDDKVDTNTGEISVNATAIGLRVLWDGGETSMELSQDGTHIKSSILKIDGDVEITGDAVIQGLLNAAGGLKTSTGSTRIDIGKFGGLDRINFFNSGILQVAIDNTGVSLVYGKFRVGGYQVVGERGAAVGNASYPAADPTQWSECVKKSDMDAFVNKFNTLLDRIGWTGGAGHGLTAD